jgi:ATP/maltotriose-dependent transcriptional regulator MalT
VTGVAELVAAAHEAFERRQWAVARDCFNAAGKTARLTADDCYAWAEAAWWLGAIDESLSAWANAYELYLEAGQPLRAAMSAMFLALHSMERGDTAAGAGWMSRVQRLLVDESEAAEHGYPLYFEIFALLGRGNIDAALVTARRMQGIGRRFGDPNLVAIGLVGEGRALIKKGAVGDGRALLDEAMLAALSGKLDPAWTGAIYCHLMEVCHELVDLRRAGEWTEAAQRWCEGLPEAVLYRGICRIHRAQIHQVQGAWEQAEHEALSACRDLQRIHLVTVAEGHYEIGELHRLRGDLGGAEEAFRRAHDLGRDPQPGLALVRLAQGRIDAAVASIGAARAAATYDRLTGARLCAADVEIALAAGDTQRAREAADELAATAAAYDSSGLEAASRQAQGAVLVAIGQYGEALRILRSAYQLWLEFPAPYDAARTRLLLAEAYAALGDSDAAALELDAAHRVFDQLGATQDARRAAVLRGRPALPGGLTEREADVLRLVAAGLSNRDIAAKLFLSDKTVARHLANIYAKLDLSSRTAAAAYAFQHGVVASR